MYQHKQTLANETPGFGDSQNFRSGGFVVEKGLGRTRLLWNPFLWISTYWGLVSLASHDKVLSQLPVSMGLTLCIQFPTNGKPACSWSPIPAGGGGKWLSGPVARIRKAQPGPGLGELAPSLTRTSSEHTCTHRGYFLLLVCTIPDVRKVWLSSLFAMWT